MLETWTPWHDVAVLLSVVCVWALAVWAVGR